ncbi:MAG: hypothetical protein P8183_10895 [Anaerolineae bacterium]
MPQSKILSADDDYKLGQGLRVNMRELKACVSALLRRSLGLVFEPGI